MTLRDTFVVTNDAGDLALRNRDERESLEGCRSPDSRERKRGRRPGCEGHDRAMNT